MLTIFRILRNFSKKEHEAFTRYGLEHPHFLLFLGLDAVLSVVLVGGGYAFATNEDLSKSERHQLVDSGGVVLTLDEVRLQTRTHSLTFYWVGDLGMNKYSTNVVNPDNVTMTYIEDNPSKPEYSKSFFVIQTYPDKERFDRALRGPVTTTANMKSINSRGDVVTFNQSDLHRAIVTLANSSKIIVLKYSEPQDERSFISDSEKLVPLN